MNELNCITHHHACDCRELKFKILISNLEKALIFVKAELIAINNYDETRYKHMTAYQVIDVALTKIHEDEK